MDVVAEALPRERVIYSPIIYPETDGKPMAEADLERLRAELTRLREAGISEI